ncbi:MAG TPA: GNAT family N-acetyltransferase [Euzebyales bacterium]|nr:GNAT family N-acetyltransferase [Euzebyales bacterium]
MGVRRCRGGLGRAVRAVSDRSVGDKPPEHLRTVFSNSMFTCFVYRGSRLIGAGRILADGLDRAYLADVAVHPDHQGRGLGSALITELVRLAGDHTKIVMYANPGTEGVYAKLGFLPMNTAMAIWRDRDRAIATGLLREPD